MFPYDPVNWNLLSNCCYINFLYETIVSDENCTLHIWNGNFLTNRYQRVVLNGQTSDWSRIYAGVPQGSILGPLFFLIYINDLSTGMSCDAKMFADDTSLFSVISDSITTATALNEDLVKVKNWAHLWKMSFNPDSSKQAQQVIFSRKLTRTNHPDIFF